MKFWGRTFLPARKARRISGRISGQISEQISEKISETSFQISRPFSETSFSRRAVLIMTFAWRPGSLYDVTSSCRRDARCRQCTGKQLSRTIWSSFDKERMSHLCDSSCQFDRTERQCTGKQMPIPPFPLHPPVTCALLETLKSVTVIP